MPGVSLRPEDRVRILSAVAKRGGNFGPIRVIAITISLAILLAVPLLGLVRVDVWGGHHLLLGEQVGLIAALKGFVIAMAILYGFTFLTNIIVGRFFCGFGCPVGYVSRLGENVVLQKQKGRLWRLFHHAAGAGFVATFIGAVMLWWVDWRVIPDGSWKARAITLGVFFALCLGGYVHAFRFRFGFCLNVCPIGIYYRYLTSKAPLSILFSEVPNPCIQCHACEKICPVALDPKALGQPLVQPIDVDAPEERYGDAECLRCGDCVAACKMVFAKDETAVPPLRYGWTQKQHAPDRSSSLLNTSCVLPSPSDKP